MKRYLIIIALLFIGAQLHGQTIQRKNLNPYVGTYVLTRGEGFDLNVYLKDGKAYLKSAFFKQEEIWLKPVRNSADVFTIEEDDKNDGEERKKLEFLRDENNVINKVVFRQQEGRYTTLVRKKEN